MTAGDKACIEIYLNYHVSELRGLSIIIVRAWNVGQDLYFNNTQRE